MTVRVLFRRDYRRFFGGHLKVWDYYNHVRAMPGVEPQIYFTPGSVWDETNPWRDERARVLSRWEPAATDVLFLAGTDWEALDPQDRERPPRPIINLIQHVRQADPGDRRFPFLSHPATRICVSPEVAGALRATGRVNGPIHTIPNGIDLEALPAPRPEAEREIDLLVVGVKRLLLPRKLALTLGWRLARALDRPPGRIEFLLRKVPRHTFLGLLSNARVALFLPNRTEGFYLPALEAMALETLVVCPDVIGNRSFCHDGENCLRPSYDERALVEATRRALTLDGAARANMIARGLASAAAHSLTAERAAFHRLLRSHLPVGDAHGP